MQLSCGILIMKSQMKTDEDIRFRLSDYGLKSMQIHFGGQKNMPFLKHKKTIFKNNLKKCFLKNKKQKNIEEFVENFEKKINILVKK